MRLFPRTATLRGRLLLLVSMVAFALVSLAAIAVWEEYTHDRERAEEQLRDQATVLALSIDREFDRAEIALKVLGSSDALAGGDLAAFEDRLRVVSEALGGSMIALLRPDGHEVLNTFWAPGERRLEFHGPSFPMLAFASGRTQVSDLHRERLAGQLVIDVVVPTPTAGQATPAYALCLSLRRDLLVRLLAEHATGQGWNGAVLDRRGHFAARSHHDAEAVDRPAPPAVLGALGTGMSGVLSGVRGMAEGGRSVVAFARSPVSGYAAVVGVPEETFLAPLRAALWRTLGAGALIASVGLLFAWLLGRRVVASLRVLEALGQGAGAMPQGTPGEMPRGGLSEVDAIAQVLADAGRRQALLVAELSHRVKNTLATVQAIAAQTLRSTGGDTARFTHDFGQRLQVLAAAHNLLTAHAWGETDLAAVVRAALGPWLDEGGRVRRIALDGPQGVTVTPRQAQAIVLALHELATNAVKHGALSRAAGRVELAWEREDGGAVALRWAETGGPTLHGTPERRGFGTRLLERALATDLGPGATVALRFEPAGLRATIRFRPRDDRGAAGP